MSDVVSNVPDVAVEPFTEFLQSEARKAATANTARDFVLAKLSADTLSQVMSQKQLLEISSSSSSDQLHRLQQEYEAKRSAVGLQFSVQAKPSVGDSSLIADIVIDPPDGSVPLSLEQRDLFNDIYTVKTVIIKACANLRAGSFGMKFFGAQDRARSDSIRTADRYLRKLQEIADYGLVRGQIDLAKRQLVSLTDEFVVSEADEIKNEHIRRLGYAAGVGALVFATAYGAILLTTSYGNWLGNSAYLFSLFIRAALGACIGTWLSFSIRKETLRFDELANLEADLLRPIYRLAFVILLTMTLCLMFTADAIQVEIGSLKTKVFAEQEGQGWPGLVALLIGVLCGISERGLAGSVQKRASEFTGSVGGTK